MTQIISLRVIKIVCLLIILFSGPVFPRSFFLSIIEVFGIFIALWTFWTNRIDKFFLSMSLPKNYRFVAKGVYKYVRYPFITAIILIAFPLVLSSYTMPRFIILITLFACSFYDILHKDKLFSKNYNDFSLYKQKTYRIIPFIF
ncbi:MAG: hypothetical protein ACRENO_07635 [Thermodesulfobacteriota bacterium]